MAAGADWGEVAGYADRLSVRPGGQLSVMVSCAGFVEARAVDLVRGGESRVAIERLAEPVAEAVRTGAHVEAAHHPDLRPGGGLRVSVWLYLAPGAPGGARRALVASWGTGGEDGWALVLDPDGRPTFEIAAGGARAAVAGQLISRDAWLLLEGAHDPGAGELSLRATTRDDARLWERRAASGVGAAGPAPGPLTIGAERRGDGADANAHLDGKLADPAVFADDRLVARWNLGEGRGPKVPDRGPLGLHGWCVNGPLRGVTGPGWTGDVHDWRAAPAQYDAMHFHADAVDDLGWTPCLEVSVDADCPGGVFGLELRAGQARDMVPFVVRRGDRPPRARVVLLPTFTYLAYSCERDAPGLAESRQPADRWTRAHGLRSLYDRYDDGCGVYEASLRRPLTQLRPGYACPQHGGPHGLAQDLILLRFLNRRGLDADVLTDHDVHHEGSASLDGARTVITGAHPEYATVELVEALERHVKGGGSLAYLGGNGINGRVSVDPQRPHVLEIRRTETAGLAWQALPGEHHHASTGGYGGDWRRQGHPEHALLGVGLSAFGSARAAAYERAAGVDPAAARAFAGLAPSEPIGAAGMVLGGAAGFEVDNHDPMLGSPADAVVLASADVGAGYEPWPDDVRDGPGVAPKLRADMVLRRAPGGGSVFSVGSIAWTGCLAGDDASPVARVTENVLRELDREHPFREGDG